MIRLAAALAAPVVAVAATVVGGPDVLGAQEHLSVSSVPEPPEPPAPADAAGLDVASAGTGAVLSPDTRRAAGPSRTIPRAVAPSDDPLLLKVNTLSPATLPERGQVTIRGTVENTSEEEWLDPKVYPLTSTNPMTTVAALREAAALDPADAVGLRITTPGVFVELPDLEAGDSARFTLRVPRDDFDATGLTGAPGVYWVGAQVLATNEDGRDEFADGRDRMFVPLVGEDAEPVSTSVVVPLRRSTLRGEDGLDDPEAWAEELAAGGRLSNLVDFVDAAGIGPITWLVDPAVLDAAARLAAGNPPRSVAATIPPEGEEPEEESGESSGGETGAVVDPMAMAADAWLDAVTASLSVHRVLALPYGDLDVAAAGQHRPALYDTARELSVETLEQLGVTARSAVVPPSGLINTEGLATAAGAEILVSDEALGAHTVGDAGPPTSALTDGELVSVYDAQLTAAATGRTLLLRQRILAEAALRALAGSDQGLLVALPHDFDPGRSSGRFFSGLDQPFVSLSAAAPTSGADVREVGKLAYSQRQVDRELDADAFGAADALIESGASLDRLLPDNDEISGDLLAEALATTSYLVREAPISAALAASGALDWSREQLSRVTIEAPEFVILSARTGPFSVIVRNRLDERVSLQIRASPNRRLVIKAPEEITLEPESQAQINLSATARSIGVSTVRLLVTDVEGQPLGDDAEVSIRSNQVGRIIWVVMGAGVGILFLAIAVRLVRRVRRARAA